MRGLEDILQGGFADTLQALAECLQTLGKGVAAEHWPSHSVRPVVRHEERKAPRNAAQALLVPDRHSPEEELAPKNIERSLAVLNARRPVMRVQHLLGMDGALHICADTIGGSLGVARAV